MKPAVSQSLSNVEIVTLAVYLAGGYSKPIDTEDIAVKASEIAPGRFSWRKYPQQINLELIRVFLSDAKKSAHGRFLNGSGNDGWSLTQAGFEFASKSVGRLNGIRARPKLSPQEQKWKRTEQVRLLNSSAFFKARSGEIDSITRAELNSFFRVDDYITGASRDQKVTRFLSAFEDHKELGSVVKLLAERLKTEN